MATRDIYETAFDEDVQPKTESKRCPECDGRVTTNIIETVCEDCGLVVDEQRIDHGPEWRSYNADERKRIGAPLTAARHDRGLSTEIGRGPDANGNTISGRKRRQVFRMRREQKRGQFQSKAERNLAHGLGEIHRIVGALSLSTSIRDQACQLFRSAQNDDLLPGRSIEAMATASVYGACRCNGLSRTLDEVSEPARVEQSRVTNAYKTLNEELGLPTKPVTPSAFIPRLASELNLSNAIRRRAIALSKQAQGTAVINGCQPSGVAAACIYKAAHDYGRVLTQKRIANAAETSVATLRARWTELK